MAKFPTGYESYSSVQLHSLFAGTNWRQMDGSHRLAACQEVENRLAAARGSEPREVVSVPMNGATYGCQYGKTIELNSHMLNDGVFCTTYTDFEGNTRTNVTEVPSPGWETLDTVNHEDMHGAWEDQGIMPNTYIRYETDPDLYRIQGCEKAAFQAGERNTLNAIREVTLATGEVDPDAQEYLSNHSGNDYQESLDRAAANYNDPDIENTLNDFISNCDEGVDPLNPSPSYQSVSELYDQQCYDEFYGSDRTIAQTSEETSQSEETVQTEETVQSEETSQSEETVQTEETSQSEETLDDGADPEEEEQELQDEYEMDDGAELEGDLSADYASETSYDSYDSATSYDSAGSYYGADDGADLTADSGSDYGSGGSYDSGYGDE